VKQIKIRVSSKGVLKSFSQESGTHRVQRVPPTESKGRVQTSIVNVSVLTEEEMKSACIDKNSVKVSYYKDSGAGGQRRNKTMSGVRLQYKGLTVECCGTRDQRRNKEIAFERLQVRLDEKQKKKQEDEKRQSLQEQNPNYGKRGNFTRNYNFMRDEVLHDGKRFKLSKIMRGDLG